MTFETVLYAPEAYTTEGDQLLQLPHLAKHSGLSGHRRLKD